MVIKESWISIFYKVNQKGQRQLFIIVSFDFYEYVQCLDSFHINNCTYNYTPFRFVVIMLYLIISSYSCRSKHSVIFCCVSFHKCLKLSSNLVCYPATVYIICLLPPSMAHKSVALPLVASPF